MPDIWNRDKIYLLAGFLSSLTLILTLYFAIPIIEFTPSGIHLNTSSDISKKQTEAILFDKKLSSLEFEVDELTYKLNGISNNFSKNNISINYSSANFFELKKNYSSMDNRISTLERVMMDNPGRVLELYILKQELDDLKTEIERVRVDTEKDIDRLYDFTKWFLLLMFTMALSVIGLVLSHFLKKTKSPAKKK
jgi:hypothetical protein